MLRLFGIPESEIAETLRRRRARRASTSTRSRSRPACAAARSRSSTRYEPGGAAGLRRVRRASCASATPTRCSPTTGTTVDEQVAALLRGPPAAHHRDGRVVHRRAAGGAADRPAGLVGLRARRRSSSTPNEAKTALAGVDPALIERARRGLAGGRAARSPTARARALRRRRRHRRSPASPGRTAGRRRSRSGSSASRSPSGRVDRRCACPATAPTSATARRLALHLLRRLLLGEPTDGLRCFVALDLPDASRGARGRRRRLAPVAARLAASPSVHGSVDEQRPTIAGARGGRGAPARPARPADRRRRCRPGHGGRLDDSEATQRAPSAARTPRRPSRARAAPLPPHVTVPAPAGRRLASAAPSSRGDAAALYVPPAPTARRTSRSRASAGLTRLGASSYARVWSRRTAPGVRSVRRRQLTAFESTMDRGPP